MPPVSLSLFLSTLCEPSADNALPLWGRLNSFLPSPVELVPSNSDRLAPLRLPLREPRAHSHLTRSITSWYQRFGWIKWCLERGKKEEIGQAIKKSEGESEEVEGTGREAEGERASQ